MGHGKETPRQKMIGLMYLFLTCMLALNVSKSVLDAFVIVNDGLNETTQGFNDKTSILYEALIKANQENPKKAQKWYDISQEVKKKTQILVDSIQMCKDTIIKTADALNPAELKKDPKSRQMTKEVEIEGTDKKEWKSLEQQVQQKDNLDFAAQVMYGQENNGVGKKLHASIDHYRNYLLSIAKDSGLKAVIGKNLSTAPKPSHEGEKNSWESDHFEHLPLIAVVTILTQMQAAVRNTESDMIAYLREQVDAGSFKFNKLQAMVIPNSTYVMQGGAYKAQIFLAAFDSTQQPEVYIGDYDSLGPNNFRMRGTPKKVDIDPKTKLCTYSVNCSSIGEPKYRGIINIKNPSGSISSYSFRQSYQVAQSALVVSPTKMNVFYIGVENPVDISVPGIPSNKLQPAISQGSITPDAKGNGYIVKVKTTGKATISVSAKVDKDVKQMGSMDFRVKRVPDPVAKVAGYKGGPIPLNLLKAAKHDDAVMENFDFDLHFAITGFNVSTKTKDGFTVDKASTSDAINSDQRTLLEGVKKGQKVYFEEIKAKGPDGSIRDLGTLMFKIE